MSLGKMGVGLQSFARLREDALNTLAMAGFSTRNRAIVRDFLSCKASRTGQKNRVKIWTIHSASVGPA
jgi:hypothetical protein